MFKFISLIAVSIFSVSVLRSQVVPAKVTDSPLNTALYLFSKESNTVEKSRLTQILRELGRDKELFDIIDETEEDYGKLESLAAFSANLSGKNTPQQTALYLSKAVALIKSSDDQNTWGEFALLTIVSGLIKENRYAEAREIIRKMEEDSVKLTLTVRAVQTALKFRRSQIAFEFLQDAARLADIDESIDDSKALSIIAGLYARFGESQKCLAILNIIERRLETMSAGKAPGIALSLIPAYLKIKQPEKASAIWRKYQPDINELDVGTFLEAILNSGYLSVSKPYLLKIRRNPDFQQIRLRDG